MSCNTEVIKLHQDGTVDKSVSVLDKKLSQQIIWVSEASQDFELRFDNGDSPFDNTSYTLPAGGWVDPGKIVASFPGSEKKFSYNTYRAGEAIAAADPDIIIKN